MTEARPHPAHVLPFDELHARLQAARDQRLVYERRGPGGLHLYFYTEKCVYDGAWDEVTISARGLILDPFARRIVATPFPKFFNVGERGQPIPELPFEVSEKLDGSLIIIFHHDGQWQTATKGAFDSWQATWAKSLLTAADPACLNPGTTYLAEAIHPENRIVVHYPTTELVMLGAYGADGIEMPVERIAEVAGKIGWRAARRHPFTSVDDLLRRARELPATEEGFVLRFIDGHRLKVKGDEYRRIHALISRVTPLAVWEVVAAGDDLTAIRRDLPEEFWTDFDSIVQLLDAAVSGKVASIGALAGTVAHLTDKELGLALPSLDPELRSFLFPWRKSGGKLLEGRARAAIYRSIRPTGNELVGYIPSYAMKRVLDEQG